MLSYACVGTLGMVGPVRVMVFFVIELKSRAAHIAGIRVDPDGAWMTQVARNLLDPVDGFLRAATHLIHDRAPLFTQAWTTLLESSGVTSVSIPAHSPNCNPHAERFVTTVRTECTDHFLVFGQRFVATVSSARAALSTRWRDVARGLLPLVSRE
ncbi:MAG: hypothetical protein ABI488_13295 [Polyangiaceae bacterium]